MTAVFPFDTMYVSCGGGFLHAFLCFVFLSRRDKGHPKLPLSFKIITILESPMNMSKEAGVPQENHVSTGEHANSRRELHAFVYSRYAHILYD